MQRDLDRLAQRKRLKRNVRAVLVVSILVALIGVGLRTCADQFSEPYNKDYTPLDTSADRVGGKR